MFDRKLPSSSSSSASCTFLTEGLTAVFFMEPLASDAEIDLVPKRLVKKLPASSSSSSAFSAFLAGGLGAAAPTPVASCMRRMLMVPRDISPLAGESEGAGAADGLGAPAGRVDGAGALDVATATAAATAAPTSCLGDPEGAAADSRMMATPGAATGAASRAPRTLANASPLSGASLVDNAPGPARTVGTTSPSTVSLMDARSTAKGKPLLASNCSVRERDLLVVIVVPKPNRPPLAMFPDVSRTICEALESAARAMAPSTNLLSTFLPSIMSPSTITTRAREGRAPSGSDSFKLARDVRSISSYFLTNASVACASSK
mmetsp:Transcript_990/g.1576  ORF Transcript_990/g.1576 Transcript_990/m.1576 type:complete len:318 (-) Transcript_990:436-1389(-)